MSWDQQAYSFGYTNARPLTPRKTPTAVCPSPGFQTPRNTSTNSSYPGLHSSFSGEYSGFNEDGHFSTNHSSTDKRRTSLSYGHRFYPPTSDDIPGVLRSNDHNTNIPLPMVDELCRPTTSSSQAPLTTQWGNVCQFDTTPQRRTFADPSSTAQTATPPSTESKGHSSKQPFGMMQDSFYIGTQLPSFPSGGFSTFPTSNVDIFGFPISAPATAPVSSISTDNFWAPDTNMSGMHMSFESSNTSFMNMPDKRSQSFDWGNSSEALGSTSLISSSYDGPPAQPAFDYNKNLRRASIAITEPLRMSINTNVPAFEDPFWSANSNNPDTSPSIRPPVTSSLGLQSGTLASSASVPPVEHPFHQQRSREFQRDEKAHHSSRPASAASSKSRKEKAAASSAKPRPGMVRSMTEVRGLGNSRRAAQPTITTNSESRSSATSNQVSPSNGRSHAGLSSIPEATSNKRSPSVIFTIDANGRARTETSYTSPQKRTTPGGPTKPLSDDWPSTEVDSSSDDDAILTKPGRSSSHKIEAPNRSSKLTLPKRPHPSPQSRSDSTFARASLTSHSSQSSHHGEGDSETEAVGGGESSGDATSALRKVMKNRQKGRMRPDLNTNRLSFDQNARRKSLSDYRAPFLSAPSQHRRGSASNRVSPSRSTAPVQSSSAQGPTRCICGDGETEGRLMVQCEACANWLHGACVRISERNVPIVYICAFCAQTPRGMRVGRVSDGESGSNPAGNATSPRG